MWPFDVLIPLLLLQSAYLNLINVETYVCQKEMRELGLFDLAIPEEYWGLELTVEEEVKLMVEIGHASPAFRSIFGGKDGIGSEGIVIDGTENQKRHYLPRMATGELIGSFAVTEQVSGSDAASLRTSARKDGNEYVLNGAKRFITNAPNAGVFTVLARTNPDNKEAAGILAFLVDADTVGVSLGTR